MKTIIGLFTAFLLVAPTAGALAQDAEPTCEDFRCALQEQLNTQCVCDASGDSNHGQYVSCVAHAVNTLAKDGGLPTNCKGKLTRCAARSTCGKAGRTTCLIPNEFSTCGDDLICDHDGVTPCTVDTDCVVSVRCKVARSDEQCAERGGTANGPGTCCSTCATPVP
jgi:hypothetical protein